MTPRRLHVDATAPGWLVLMEKVLKGTPRLDGALCTAAGLWALFDAEDGRDSAEAAQAVSMCSLCPAKDPCAIWARSLGPSVRPAGVTAGRFHRRGAP